MSWTTTGETRADELDDKLEDTSWASMSWRGPAGGRRRRAMGDDDELEATICLTFNNMSSSYEFKDTVADKLQAVTNLINEGAVLLADEVRVVTTLKDEGALEAAVPETIPEDEADDRWSIVGMESIINEVWKCFKKEEEEKKKKAEEEEMMMIMIMIMKKKKKKKMMTMTMTT
ncbi:hypothetical protein LWI29_008852 [Acer saccharum]|uniref:Uncharacterized protein n=1 Tax=Acer saccharum TaxID=4024 RepID=A0AA39SU09_ACESA|nr:hypothetical protein LWI29_008852 [Acer saccharum]